MCDLVDDKVEARRSDVFADVVVVEMAGRLGTRCVSSLEV